MCFLHQKKANTARTSTATPPTTPPAIAPVGVDEPLLIFPVAAVPEDAGDEVGEVDVDDDDDVELVTDGVPRLMPLATLKVEIR